jgi:hypothetical protein
MVRPPVQTPCVCLHFHGRVAGSRDAPDLLGQMMRVNDRHTAINGL